MNHSYASLQKVLRIVIVVWALACLTVIGFVSVEAEDAGSAKPEPRLSAAEAYLSNNLLRIRISERQSTVWEYQYTPGVWGESNYHELFALYTPAGGIIESPSMTIDQPFANPGGGPGSVNAVLSTSQFTVRRTVTLPSGNARYLLIAYDIANKTGATLQDVRFFQAIDFDIPRTGDHTDDYGWYDSTTDYIGVRDDEHFRNVVASVPASDRHGVDYWNTQIYSDWDDGNLANKNSYGPGDPAVAKQFNLGNLAPGQSEQVAFYVWFGDPAPTEDVCLQGRVWQSGSQGLPGATVHLLHQVSQQVHTTTTDAAGDFAFNDLTAGRYQLRITKPNFSIYHAILNLSQGCGRTDPRLWPAESIEVFELARNKAPIIYQDTDEESELSDFLTRANFDGNWDSTDNWQHTTTASLPAYVYWDAASTVTHHFIKYYRFYPRDWGEFSPVEHGCVEEGGGLLSWRCHENDLEGSAIAINRATGEIQFMVVMRHGVQASTCEANASRGPLNKMSVERMTHAGECHFQNDTLSFPDADGVIYRYGATAEVPASRTDDDVKYDLLHVNDLRWLIGTGDGQLAFTPDYQRFRGDDHGQNRAATPWALPINDVPDGTARTDAAALQETYQGDLFADPARLFAALFPGANLTTDYTYNPNLTAVSTFQPQLGAWAATPAGEATVFLPFGAIDTAAAITLGYDVPDDLPAAATARSGEVVRLLGRPFSLTATRSAGGQVTAFYAPARIEVNYSPNDLEALGVAPGELHIARWHGNVWQALPTQVNSASATALIFSETPGVFALFSGEPRVQVIAPIFLPTVLQIPYVPPAKPLLNGDFEAGRTGWQEISAQGWQLIISRDQVPNMPTHSGLWAAWLGGDDDEIAFVRQEVTVPAGQPWLTYYHGIASEDTCGHDFGGVIVNDVVVDQYNLCQSANTSNWVRHSVNLSAYAGQTVWLQIRAETNGSQNSNLLVDDVAFTSATQAAAGAPVRPFVAPAGLRPTAQTRNDMPRLFKTTATR